MMAKKQVTAQRLTDNLTVQQIAKILGLDPQTMQHYLRRTKLEPVYAGGKGRITLLSVLQAVALGLAKEMRLSGETLKNVCEIARTVAKMPVDDFAQWLGEGRVWIRLGKCRTRMQVHPELVDFSEKGSELFPEIVKLATDTGRPITIESVNVLPMIRHILTKT